MEIYTSKQADQHFLAPSALLTDNKASFHVPLIRGSSETTWSLRTFSRILSKGRSLLVALLLIFAFQWSYGIEVTFQVNMQEETVDPAGVFIAGEFNGFVNGPMVNVSGDIWAVTLTLDPSTTYEYKFKNGPNGWETGLTLGLCGAISPFPPEFNRVITTGTVDETVSLVCFDSCDPCPPLPAFQVGQLTFTTMQAAIDQLGSQVGEIVLIRDYTEDAVVSLPSYLTLVIPDGNILTFSNAVANAGTIMNSSTLVLQGALTNTGTYSGVGIVEGDVVNNGTIDITD